METIAQVKVTVYTKPNCVQCNATYKALDKHGIEYDIVNLPDHPEMIEYFKSQGHLGAPVVQAGPDNTWAGFRPDRIKALAKHAA